VIPCHDGKRPFPQVHARISVFLCVWDASENKAFFLLGASEENKIFIAAHSMKKLS
jgi:hypothetical protein